MSAYHLLNPRERQAMLTRLKHGPACESQEELLAVTRQLYKIVTKRDLAREANKHMASWYKDQLTGAIPANFTFLY